MGRVRVEGLAGNPLSMPAVARDREPKIPDRRSERPHHQGSETDGQGTTRASDLMATILVG